MKKTICFAAACLCLVAAMSASAQTITIAASADNTLYEDFTGSTSNGGGQYLFAGLTGADFKRRGLISFDIASALPAGAAIQSVSLTLHLSRTITGTEEVTLHQVLQEWGEGSVVAFGEEGAGAPADPGDATWQHRHWDSVPWNNPGGDFDPSPAATSSVVGPGYYNWSSAELVALAQQWLVHPEQNHGLAVLGNESATATAKRFDSRNHLDPEVRPILTITLVPSPATAVISATTMIFATRRARSTGQKQVVS